MLPHAATIYADQILLAFTGSPVRPAPMVTTRRPRRLSTSATQGLGHADDRKEGTPAANLPADCAASGRPI